MSTGLLAKKMGMTQIFTPEGDCIAVTVLEAGPCTVVRRKTAEKDGYDALVLGFGAVDEKHARRLSKPEVGVVRRANAETKGRPRALEIEEYSHYGMVGRYTAGASGLPFFPLRSYTGSDLPKVNKLIRFIDSPFGDESVAVVPPINPDVTIVHAQRADKEGNAHVWGLLGAQKEAAFAGRKVIVVAEEIVDEAVIRADPNRTLIPGLIVNAVVHEPYGAHPSYVQGYYDRDNELYVEWEKLSRDEGRVKEWLDEWVYSLADRSEYIRKLGDVRLQRLRPGTARAAAVEYGEYR